MRMGFVPLLFLIASCHPSEDLLATVNGEPIRKEAIAYELIFAHNTPGSGISSEAKELLRALLDQEIEEVLLAQESERHGIRPDPEQIEFYLEIFQSAAQPADLNSRSRLKREAKRQATITAFLESVLYPNGKPSVEDFRKYYNEHKEQFMRPEQIHIRQILVGSHEQAIQIEQRLRRKEDFGELARRFSISPEAASGGDLGFFARGELPQEIEEACFKLPLAATSPIVSTPYGYHIFRVEERRPESVVPFEEALPQIADLFSEELDRRITLLTERLKEDAKIVIYEKNLEKLL